ncbi:MAG: alpha/beta fold hydrolase, partial [Burkholderiales bacterium]|nr:alpha/beta fold hydrolase [Burkholderiales bacterium]
APDASALGSRAYEPPHNGVEQLLAKAWAAVLQVSRIGRDDHFFELGGHSLLAIQLITQASNRDLTLTISDIYQHPTLRAQAQHLTGSSTPIGTAALAARRSGSERPVFIVPTGLGDITYAFELTSFIDPQVPSYVLPWPEDMPRSMEALAAHAVALMRAIQPEGPYRIVGASSGALLAYAMAQHLAEQDLGVDLLGLVDCGNDEAPAEQLPHDEGVKQSLLGSLDSLLERDGYRGHEPLRQLLDELREFSTGASVEEFVARCADEPVLQWVSEQEQTTIRQVQASCVRSLSYAALWPKFLAQPLSNIARFVVLYALERDPEPPTDALGWTSLRPQDQIELIPAPGNHVSMLERPHVQELGRLVSQSLAAPRPRAPMPAHVPALVLQSGRSGTAPIVCVPGASASVASFVSLGIALGDARPLLGMQPRGLDGRTVPYGPVELAASRYLAALREHVPRGQPVHLVGHSFGGHVAFEMALQLCAANTPPASLMLIDVEAPDDSPQTLDTTRDEVIDRFLEAVALRT